MRKRTYFYLTAASIMISLIFSSVARAESVCIDSGSNYYRINYIAGGGSGTTVKPGKNKVDVDTKTINKLYDWDGNFIADFPDISKLTPTQMLQIATKNITIVPLVGSCSGPIPPSGGKPQLPNNFQLTQSATPANPPFGKEYVTATYDMWYGDQAHFVDLYQDSVHICPQNQPDCQHTTIFQHYVKGSKDKQSFNIIFGPTTITKHKYRLVLTNDQGNSEADYDLNLAQNSVAKPSPMTVTVNKADQNLAYADTPSGQSNQIVILTQNKSQSIGFNITDTTSIPGQGQAFKLNFSNPGLLITPPNVTQPDGSFILTPQTNMMGRSSLRITDSAGNVRYIGITFVNKDFYQNPKALSPDAKLNNMLPSYIAIGSMTEDNSDAVNYWRHFNSKKADQNRRVDIRYVYLNQWSNGNEGGWAKRAENFTRNGLQLGQIPFYVEYNINGGQDNPQSVYDNLQSADFMQKYFSHLAQAAQIAYKESGNTPVGFIIEPDSLGYLLHNLKEPVTMPVDVDAAYTAQMPVDPDSVNIPYSQKQNIPASTTVLDRKEINIPNTLQGFVQAVNYILWKYTNGTAVVGWQMNLWASPDNNGKGIIHFDPNVIKSNAQALAKQGQSLGIRPSMNASENHPWDNAFISIDKYGLDGAGVDANDKTHPAESSWFWNAGLYDNYLLFADNLAYPNIEGVKNLPIILWQIPVGHLNRSLSSSPYTQKLFQPLTDISGNYEDSSPTYFYGDTFQLIPGDISQIGYYASGEFTTCNQTKLPYFACPDSENGVSVTMDKTVMNITWKPHMKDAQQAHVAAILFGAGVGASTHGHPLGASTSINNNQDDPDTANTTPDSNWFMFKTQQYYANPIPRLK